MSNVSELKITTAAQAVKAIEKGNFPGDRARSDSLLYSLRNQADFAVTARNAATSALMAIEAAERAMEKDHVPCFTSATVTSAKYRAKEAVDQAQAALEHIRSMVRARFVEIGCPVPPHYHTTDCLCEICSPLPTCEETEHA